VYGALHRLCHSRRMPERLLESRAARGQSADLPNRSEFLVLSHDSSRIGVHRLRRHVTATAAVLFLLILSGPPRMRIRDPEASLRGDVDWVVVIHLLVWGSGDCGSGFSMVEHLRYPVGRTRALHSLNKRLRLLENFKIIAHSDLGHRMTRTTVGPRGIGLVQETQLVG